ncbi:MAG: carbonic anhydrase [Ignavibacteria bacterium]|nr:carbonic anhydrase [Ignavibacteria bacterium]
MRTHTQESQDKLTPDHALEILKEGNERFVNNIKAHRNLLQQVNETSSGQFPFAAILSCIDSRTSAELIFDQGLGDIFSIRIAGNILNADILGSMEFACSYAGSKLIVVLGHTKCGAIGAACDTFNDPDVIAEPGHIAGLLRKINPAIELETKSRPIHHGDTANFMKKVTTNNVALTVQSIPIQSPLLAEMEREGKIKIIGGLHNIDTGKVTFYE